LVNCFYVGNSEGLLNSHDRQIKAYPNLHSVDIKSAERHCPGDFNTVSDNRIFLLRP